MSYPEEIYDRLVKNQDKKKGPWKNVGPKCPPKRRSTPNKKRTPKEKTESTIQREVILQARRMGLHLWRQQAGIIFTGQYSIQLAPKGAADLTGILQDGRRLEVECKRRFGGIQSNDQKEWQGFIEKNKGIYLLVHSGDEFKEKIKEILNKNHNKKFVRFKK